MLNYNSWNDNIKVSFLGFETTNEMNELLDQLNSQWPRQNAINYIQNSAAENAAAFSFSKALSQWTNPSLVIGGLSAGVAGFTAKLNVYRVYGNGAKSGGFYWITVNSNTVIIIGMRQDFQT